MIKLKDRNTMNYILLEPKDISYIEQDKNRPIYSNITLKNDKVFEVEEGIKYLEDLLNKGLF